MVSLTLVPKYCSYSGSDAMRVGVKEGRRPQFLCFLRIADIKHGIAVSVAAIDGGNVEISSTCSPGDLYNFDIRTRLLR